MSTRWRSRESVVPSLLLLLDTTWLVIEFLSFIIVPESRTGRAVRHIKWEKRNEWQQETSNVVPRHLRNPGEGGRLGRSSIWRRWGGVCTERSREDKLSKTAGRGSAYGHSAKWWRRQFLVDESAALRFSTLFSLLIIHRNLLRCLPNKWRSAPQTHPTPRQKRKYREKTFRFCSLVAWAWQLSARRQEYFTRNML